MGHLLDAGNPGATYLWNTGEKTRTIKTKNFGTYWVEVSNSCGKIRDTIIVFDLTGIHDNKSNDISIYPNPGKGIMTITGTELLNPVFEVFDLYGRSAPVHQETIETGSEYLIRMSDATPGVYYLSWINGDQIFRKSFVVE